MSKKYRCKKAFSVNVCDDDGGFTDKYMYIEEGSVWELSDDKQTLTGAELKLENGTKWIETYKERLDEHFKEIEECEHNASL